MARGVTPASSVHRPVHHQVPSEGRGRRQPGQAEVRALAGAQHQAEPVLRRCAPAAVAASPARVPDCRGPKGGA